MVVKRSAFFFGAVLAFSLTAQAQNKSSNSNSQKQAEAARKAEEARLAAEAKKAEEERARKEKAEKEKDPKRAAYEKALADAIAEDKANSVQRFDVVFEFDGFRNIVRSDGLAKDRSGKVASTFEGADLYGQGVSGSYKSAGMDEIVREEKHLNVHLRSMMKDAGLKVLRECEAQAIDALGANAKLRLVAKNVPRHTLFVTEREMLIRYGYEKFLSRLMKDKRKMPSLKKYLEEIDDLMAPRRGVSLAADSIQLSCEIVK